MSLLLWVLVTLHFGQESTDTVRGRLGRWNNKRCAFYLPDGSWIAPSLPEPFYRN